MAFRPATVSSNPFNFVNVLLEQFSYVLNEWAFSELIGTLLTTVAGRNVIHSRLA